RRELGVARRVGEAFQPELEEPALAVLVAARELTRRRAHLRARRLFPRGSPEHACELVVHALVQQLDEELLATLEVGIEGAAAESGGLGDLLHGGAREPAAAKDILGCLEQ